MSWTWDAWLCEWEDLKDMRLTEGLRSREDRVTVIHGMLRGVILFRLVPGGLLDGNKTMTPQSYEHTVDDSDKILLAP